MPRAGERSERSAPLAERAGERSVLASGASQHAERVGARSDVARGAKRSESASETIRIDN